MSTPWHRQRIGRGSPGRRVSPWSCATPMGNCERAMTLGRKSPVMVDGSSTSRMPTSREMSGSHTWREEREVGGSRRSERGAVDRQARRPSTRAYRGVSVGPVLGPGPGHGEGGAWGAGVLWPATMPNTPAVESAHLHESYGLHRHKLLQILRGGELQVPTELRRHTEPTTSSARRSANTCSSIRPAPSICAWVGAVLQGGRGRAYLKVGR